MKKVITLLASLVSMVAFSQVGVGTTKPHESAILEVKSKDKGFLAPRLTTAQRQTIQQPSPGLMIYNYDTKMLRVF